jgi:hypothetical protein
MPNHDPPPAAGTPWLGPRIDYRPAMPVADPPGRVVFGGVVVFAAVMVWQIESLARISYWMLFFAGFGVAMMVSGIRQQQHDARVQREIRRAEAEWADLVAEAAGHRQTTGLVRMLQQRGYRNYFVRRWLEQRLEQELASGTAQPPGDPND